MTLVTISLVILVEILIFGFLNRKLRVAGKRGLKNIQTFTTKA